MPLIRALAPEDAPGLAGLVAGYRAAMSGDRVPVAATEAEALAMIGRVADGRTVLIGADVDGALAGFAHAFDLPELISGRRAGQLDDLFVRAEARGSGVARALIAHLVQMGAARGWTHLRWLVPQGNAAARQLYLAIAEPAPWDSFCIRLPAPATGRGRSGPG